MHTLRKELIAMKIIKSIIAVLTVVSILFITSCARTREWTNGISYTSYENADLEQCSEIPEYIASDLPADFSASYVEERSDSDQRSYQLYMDNFEKYGRYDGLAVGLYSAWYYPVSDNSGYLMKHYGVNQAARQNISEVYYYVDREYVLLDSTGDSYASYAAICDGSMLYYLLSDGTLRCISQSGEKTDHKNVVDVSANDINFISLTGSDNAVEIYSYDNTVIGRIELG